MIMEEPGLAEGISKAELDEMAASREFRLNPAETERHLDLIC